MSIKDSIYHNRKKSTVKAYLLFILLGWTGLGLHKLYTKDIGFFLTYIGCWIFLIGGNDTVSSIAGTIIGFMLLLDLFWIYFRVKDYNEKLIMDIYDLRSK